MMVASLLLVAFCLIVFAPVWSVVGVIIYAFYLVYRHGNPPKVKPKKPDPPDSLEEDWMRS